MADGHCVRTCRQAVVQYDIRHGHGFRVSRNGNKGVQRVWLTSRHSLRSNIPGSCTEERSCAIPSASLSAMRFYSNAVHRLKSKGSKYCLEPGINFPAVEDSKYVLKPTPTCMAWEGLKSLRRKRGLEVLNAIPGYPDAPQGPRYYLGMDFGTSGARAIVIDGETPVFGKILGNI